MIFLIFSKDFFGFFASFQAVSFVNAGFWRLKAPETNMWAPEGAFGPKKAKIHRCFAIFSAVFPNIWPLAGPNIAKKGWPLQALARGDRQTHVGTVNFWLKP